jgi:hypothetical protein
MNGEDCIVSSMSKYVYHQKLHIKGCEMCGTNAKKTSAYRVSGNLKKKSQLLRPRHRWEDIKTDLQNNMVGVGVVDWTDLAQVTDR